MIIMIFFYTFFIEKTFEYKIKWKCFETKKLYQKYKKNFIKSVQYSFFQFKERYYYISDFHKFVGRNFHISQNTICFILIEICIF